MQSFNDTLESLRTAIFILGLFLVLSGAITLIVLGVTTYDVIKDPENVQFIKFFSEKINLTDEAFHGHAGDKEVEIRMSEPVRYLIFGFMGLVMLSIMVSIVNGIIGGGIALVRLAIDKEKSNKTEKTSSNPYDRAD